MKINIRRNVFETNSSSTHMYTFQKRTRCEKKTTFFIEEYDSDFFEGDSTENKKIEVEAVSFSGAVKKYAAINWLLHEVGIYGRFVIGDPLDGDPLDTGSTNKYVTLENVNRKTLEKIKILTNSKKEASEEEIIESIFQLVTNNEKEPFEKIDYNYPLYFENGEVIDKMNEIERVTLALKFIFFSELLLSSQYNNNEKAKIIETTFDNILNKQVGSELLEITCLTNSQLMNKKDFFKAFEEVKKDIKIDNFERLFEKARNLGIEGHLYEDYNFTDLTTNLKLNCETYARFKKSVLDLVTNDDIFIDIY